MTSQTVQLHRNLPQLLRRFSLEELYTVAQCLANELALRDLDAHQEGRALELALLVLARAEHRSRLEAELGSDYRDARLEQLLGDGSSLIG
jgi:hypothetical protein